MQILRAVIIEDEENSREALKNMLHEFCENLEVVGAAETVASGVKLIVQTNPDIVFLDIELPNESGFELFNYFPKGNFDVVFTTAYEQFAVKAFKSSAIDYLLKPIDIEELKESVEKVRSKKESKSLKERLDTLKSNLNNNLHKLALPTSSGYVFVALDEIVRCEAQGGYTKFYFQEGQNYLVTRTLGLYENLLVESNFFRINRTDLVNLNFVSKYIRQKRPVILLSDGVELSLSESRKQKFLELFEK